MGIEKYRVKVHPSFEKYYDLFRNNILRGKTYKITLTTGESIKGIPKCGLALLDITDPHVSFTLQSIAGDLYKIPFMVLEKAEEQYE